VVIINEGQLMASGSLEDLTASFRKKDGIIVKVKKEIKKAISLLKEIPGVETVSKKDNEVNIEWSQDKDLRDEVSKTIVRNDLGLVEMRPLAMNIEDMYLKVVSGGVEQ